jgi:uncharacterized protein YciI
VILKSQSGVRGAPPNHQLHEAHVEYLHGLNDRGSLVSCGVYKTLDKGFMILQGMPVEEVLDIVKNYPLISSGYYSEYEIDELLSPNCDER